jgi:hypothetical protein
VAKKKFYTKEIEDTLNGERRKLRFAESEYFNPPFIQPGSVSRGSGFFNEQQLLEDIDKRNEEYYLETRSEAEKLYIQYIDNYIAQGEKDIKQNNIFAAITKLTAALQISEDFLCLSGAGIYNLYKEDLTRIIENLKDRYPNYEEELAKQDKPSLEPNYISSQPLMEKQTAQQL